MTFVESAALFPLLAVILLQRVTSAMRRNHFDIQPFLFFGVWQVGKQKKEAVHAVQVILSSSLLRCFSFAYHDTDVRLVVDATNESLLRHQRKA